MDKINIFKKRWLKEICLGDVDKYIQITGEGGEGTGNGYKHEIFLYLFTDNYRYCIHAKDESKNDGYLGCVVSTRKPRAGEDWTRGNDLPDGKFDRKTWNKIKNAIIRYELIQIEPKINRLTDGEIECQG